MEEKEKIKSILLDGFIEVDDSDELTYELPLISSGILDSISILQLIDVLEKNFNIEFEAHEIDKEKFDSVNLIYEMVKDKMS